MLANSAEMRRVGNIRTHTWADVDESLIKRLQDGKEQEIDRREFDRYLAARPAAYHIDWNGKSWNFAFAERSEAFGPQFGVYVFRAECGKHFYACKTDLVNPFLCDVPLEEQLNGGKSLIKALQFKQRQDEPRGRTR